MKAHHRCFAALSEEEKETGHVWEKTLSRVLESRVMKYCGTAEYLPIQTSALYER
jgi:hypothetical protein